MLQYARLSRTVGERRAHVLWRSLQLQLTPQNECKRLYCEESPNQYFWLCVFLKPWFKGSGRKNYGDAAAQLTRDCGCEAQQPR